MDIVVFNKFASGNGEMLTKCTIWVTILGYAAGSAALALSRRRHRWESAARLAWTVGCIALIAHVAAAFHFYHGWSHVLAYRDTARQTSEVVGLHWGGGLYINYALLTVWTLDVIWWWARGIDAYRRRAWPLVVAWHGFLIFIIFNATVVFKTGFVRWAGLCVCLGLGIVWASAARGNSTRENPLAVVDQAPEN